MSLGGDTTRRDQLARNLCARICDGRRSVDELRVLDQLLRRVELGADRYGPLDLAKARDWDAELAEELLDVQVYRAIGMVLEREDLLDEISALGQAETAAAAPGVAHDWDLSSLGGES